MKTKNHIICFAILAVLLAGCHGKAVDEYEGMSNEELLEVLDIRLDRKPNDVDLLYRRAQVLLQLERNNDAIHDLVRASQLEPKRVDLLLLLADGYMANGNVEQGYKTLSTALELEPDNKEVLLKQAEITFFSRDYDRAMGVLDKVTDQDPNNRTALFMKGYIHMEKGDTARAVSVLRRVCDLYPDYAPAFEVLGVLCSNAHNAMAAEYLGTALRLDPNNTNILYAMAQYCQDIEQMDEAEQYYKRLLEINPASADALHNLGYIELFYYRDYDHAIDYFNQALEADPSHLGSMINRGCAYELQGKKAEARADFGRALLIDPTNASALDGMKRTK